MKNIFICLFALLFLANCTDDKDEFIIGKPNNEEGNSQPSGNTGIEKRLFDVINLDYPGLAEVKKYYEAEDYSKAAQALLEYYRLRTEIVNPNISLIATTASASEQNIAEQALDYRFYVRNFQETKGEIEAENIYYSFKKEDGTIDWNMKVADIKDNEFMYQRHRHQWMVPQAKTYRVTQNEAYVKSWIEVYTDWMKNFPCPEGVTPEDNYPWIGLQVAERVTSQIELMTYYLYSDNFTPEWLSIFLTQFSDEVENIRRNYYSDSNILVTQIYAVTMAGILLPEFKNAQTWLEEGAQKMNQEVELQFNEDGVHYELDPSYHIGAISDFYNIYEIAKANNKQSHFPNSYMEALRKATEFVMDITYPNYTMDNFNDTRSARMGKSVLIKNFKRYLEMFPDNENMKWMATEGHEGKRPTYTAKAYDYSGYYVLRNGWNDSKNTTMMILKNNYNPENKWHCQPDNGTFSLYHNGRNFFPDSGVFAYSGDETNRNKFRQTQWHNTMTIFNYNIDKTEGRFLKMETQDNNTHLIVTENDSYIVKGASGSQQAHNELSHRRAVFYVNNKFFVLVDEMHGSEGGKKYNLNFNLCPKETADSEVIIDNDKDNNIFGAHTDFADGNNIIVRTFGENKITDAVSPFTSQVSNDLTTSTNRKGYSVTLRKKATVPAVRAITVIVPTTNAKSTTISAKFTDEGYTGKGVAIQVIVDGTEHNLSYTLPENN
ncbi:heparin-sulfate lyase HepC [Bacteroides congonensis]